MIPPPHDLAAMTEPTPTAADRERAHAVLRQAAEQLATGAVAPALAMLAQLGGALAAEAAYWTVLAKAQLAAGHPQGAIEAAQRAVGLDPRQPAAIGVEALALLQLGRGDEADAAVRRGLAQDPDDPELLRARSAQAFLRGDPAAALADLDRAIAANPAFVDALVARSQLRARQGDVEAALSDAEAAARHGPRSVPASLALARLLAIRGRHAEALDRARAVIALDPARPDGYIETATILHWMGQGTAAVDQLVAGAGALPGNADLAARAGVALAQAGRHWAALPQLERALQLGPLRRDVVVTLAECLDRLLRSDEAEARLRDAVARLPDDAELKANLALFLVARAKLDAARLLAGQAWSAAPASMLARAAAIAVGLPVGPLSGPDPELAAFLLRIVAGTRRPEWRDPAAAAAFARRLSEAAAALDPGSGAAPALIAVRPLGRDDAAGTIEALERAAALQPEDAAAWSRLAEAQGRLGRLDDAVEAARRAVALQPDDAALLTTKATLLGRRGVQRPQAAPEAAADFAEAAVAARAALARDSSGWATLVIALDALEAVAATDEARAVAERLIQHYPFRAEGYRRLALILLRQGRRPEAEIQARRAVERDPQDPRCHLALAGVLCAGARNAEALDAVQAALARDPLNMDARGLRGSILNLQGRFDEALDQLEALVREQPDDYRLHMNTGFLYFQKRRPFDSIRAMSRALELNPRLPEGYQLRGASLSLLARHDEAVVETARAVDLMPERLDFWTSHLFGLSYHPTLPAERIVAEFRRWGAAQAHLAQPERGWDVVPDPGRRLRIGYVSPDFRAHTSRFYYEPLFEHHDRAQVELFAYASVGVPDGETQRLRTYFDHWRPIQGLSDDEAAELVRRDRIDILVDATNHMAQGRLLLFARKPAPVQVTWLGSIWTTGLAAMDYTLQDPHMAPPGAEAVFTERIWRLPHSLFCFRPPDLGAVAPLPARAKGHVTFGYTGRTERLNERVVRTWARILDAVPDARLVLDFQTFGDPAARDHFAGLFRAAGADLGRIAFGHTKPVATVLAEIDILLDSFPHSGGTMLFDALWLGVPVLTLAERPPCGRIGAGLMANLGLVEWVAADEDAYVAKAAAFAGRIDALDDLRRTLRDRMRASPLMDETGFAAAVDQAFRTMWQDWCRTQPAAPAAATAEDRVGPVALWSTRRQRWRGDYRQALSEARAAVAAHPDSPAAALALAEALIELGEEAEAAPILDRLVAAADPPEGAWVARGRCHLADNQAEAALEAARRAQAQDPLSHAAAAVEARAHLKAGAGADAVAAAQIAATRAVTLAQDDPEGALVMALVRLLQGRPAEALPMLEAAAAMAPSVPEQWEALAMAYARRGKLDLADMLAARAAAAKPHLWRALCLRAEIARHGGRPADAERLWRQALPHAPFDGALLFDIARLREQRL